MNKGLLVLPVLALLGACTAEKEAPQVAPVKVKTLVVGTTATGSTTPYSGTIEESSGTSLSFSAIGTVQSINVSQGQLVQKGQLIGVIDATSARNAYDAAVAMKEQALDAQERLSQLHDAGSLTDIKWMEVQTQVRQAQASEQIARKTLDDTRLVAPFSGFVAQKSVEAGANVGPGMQVVRLVKIDQVKVRLSVPEEEVARFTLGQRLAVSVAALGGRTFEATVSERGVSADPLSRSYDVKALIANPHHELLPGMIAEVTAPLEGKANGGESFTQEDTGKEFITLPADIIQIDADNRPFVWKVVAGKAQRAFVELGANAAQQVVIAGGLMPGDLVISEGQQKVSTGMKVQQ